MAFTLTTNEADDKPLTGEQKKAASHKKGPACVIAGAGTGKTTTLSGRIVYLVKDQGCDPKRLVITTFTRKATVELYERAHQQLGDLAQQLRISTIDALIWDLAQRAMQRGLIRTARLFDGPNRRVLLLHCAWEAFGQKNAYSKNSWIKAADDHRINLLNLLEDCTRRETATRVAKQDIKRKIRSRLREISNTWLYDDLGKPSLRELEQTINSYFEQLRTLGATDYNLLSNDFLSCLKRHRKIVKEFACEIDAILVDEFQDTSNVQTEILLLLSGKDRNIWVVGDPCQQIYEWRGAGPRNLHSFIKKTRALKYHLIDNRRSTQPILDCAYRFLSRRVPSLKHDGMLKRLKSVRDKKYSDSEHAERRPVFLGKIDQAFSFVKQILETNSGTLPRDVAILSRRLDRRTIREIENKARGNGLNVQIHSSRADRAVEQTIESPLPWKPGTALKNLYSHPEIRNLVSRSLSTTNFGDIRTIRPIATAAEALDSTLHSKAFTFAEAWPALKNTRDRDISITPAVVSNPAAIQVMTIHAAKGLEFPVVLLMKLGKGGPKSFPNPDAPEDSRLTYVGATRARDFLILVRTGDKLVNLKKTISAFGKIDRDILRIRVGRHSGISSTIDAPAVSSALPVVAATDLDLYEQCPLKFAAYHEGRFLPKWSVPQSKGSRMHKALEYYLRTNMPRDRRSIELCFKRGIQDGDSPLRPLPEKDLRKMKEAYFEMTKELSRNAARVLAIVFFRQA